MRIPCPAGEQEKSGPRAINMCLFSLPLQLSSSAITPFLTYFKTA
uniref:Uncharacterized protein n=1 Tax=Anguilla anguilla TaxID=7936 RepID=A0A0E9QSU6_ANGAN